MECSLRSLTEAKSLEREGLLGGRITTVDAARTHMRRERPHPLTHRASRITLGRSRLATLIACSCDGLVLEAENQREKHCVGRGTRLRTRRSKAHAAHPVSQASP